MIRQILTGIAVVGIPLLLGAIHVTVTRWLPLRRIKKRLGIGMSSPDLAVSGLRAWLGREPVEPQEFARWYGPGGMLTSPLDAQFGWLSRGIDADGWDRRIRYMGPPPKWLIAYLRDWKDPRTS